MKLQANFPVVSKYSLYIYEPFPSGLTAEKRVLFPNLASNCPVLVAKFSRQSNSLIYWKKLQPENYWTVFCDIWTIARGDRGIFC